MAQVQTCCLLAHTHMKAEGFLAAVMRRWKLIVNVSHVIDAVVFPLLRDKCVCVALHEGVAQSLTYRDVRLKIH